MTEKSIRIDPPTRDRIRRKAALALHEAAPTNGSLALAVGVRPETTSRYRSASRSSPIARFYEYIHMLAASTDTTPFPLLAAGHITALEGIMASMDGKALVRRYWQLRHEAAEAQRVRARAEAAFAKSGDLEALEAAEHEVASVAQESAAIVRLLRKKEVDPRDPEWGRP